MQAVRLTALPPALIGEITANAERENFGFLRRLIDDWANGSNRFDRPGEALFGIVDGERLMAIGGVNRISDRIGRVRRFYVLPEFRRKGVGASLFGTIREHSAEHYEVLELRSEFADSFWRSQGFQQTGEENPTHRLFLEKDT